MKLNEKYHERNPVMFEMFQAFMYGVITTRVELGMVPPSQGEMEKVFNKFIDLDNPCTDAIKEPLLLNKN